MSCNCEILRKFIQVCHGQLFFRSLLPRDGRLETKKQYLIFLLAPTIPLFNYSWKCLTYFEKPCKTVFFYIRIIDDLKQELLCAWNNISKTYLRSLYSVFSKICRRVIASKDSSQNIKSKYKGIRSKLHFYSWI